jgi:hypothetical protein
MTATAKARCMNTWDHGSASHSITGCAPFRRGGL